MNFLREQDDFFQTGNQSISVGHLSLPYNNIAIIHVGQCLCPSAYYVLPNIPIAILELPTCSSRR